MIALLKYGPLLKPLPLQGFAYFTQSLRTVCDDSCVRVDHNSYAARPAPIDSRVLVRLFEQHLEIRDFQSQALLRTHPRATQPGSVILPDEERPFNPSRETRRILTQAKAIGPATEQLCQCLFEQEGRVGQRRLWGIVSLAKRYPRTLIDRDRHLTPVRCTTTQSPASGQRRAVLLTRNGSSRFWDNREECLPSRDVTRYHNSPLCNSHDATMWTLIFGAYMMLDTRA
jgi:hypothetical protein